MSNLLYYPYIDLPRTDWTLRTLLYYDNIGSIVPQEYFYNPGQHDPFMRELVHMELVTPINPIETLRNPWGATEPFLEHINQNRAIIENARQRFRNQGNNRKLARIHADKFHQNVFYSLEELGLATRTNHQWYEVDRKIADELMLFLATLVAKTTNRLPTTDHIPRNFPRDILLRQQSKRETILATLIPFPEDIDLRRLQRFKEQHSDLLRNFRNKVELIVLNPEIKEGTALFHEHVAELLHRKEELTAKMNESQFGKILFRTVCGTIGAFTGLPAGGTTGAIVGALPGFISAIHSALEIERPEGIFDQSGLKYLALADKRLTTRR